MKKRYVEVHADGWWFMFDDDHDTAVDLGRSRYWATRWVAIWCAYVRQWWRSRHETAGGEGGT